MADTVSNAIDQARQAADAASLAAQRAHEAVNAASASNHFGGMADGAAALAHAASGGVIDPFVFRLSIFVLAIFVGYYVVWSVTPALHTPLMSVTNAISSVIVVGALLSVSVPVLADGSTPIAARIFGFLALIMASVNIFGGFLVTSRMLAMYKKKQR